MLWSAPTSFVDSLSANSDQRNPICLKDYAMPRNAYSTYKVHAVTPGWLLTSDSTVGCNHASKISNLRFPSMRGKFKVRAWYNHLNINEPDQSCQPRLRFSSIFFIFNLITCICEPEEPQCLRGASDGVVTDNLTTNGILHICHMSFSHNDSYMSSVTWKSSQRLRPRKIRWGGGTWLWLHMQHMHWTGVGRLAIVHITLVSHSTLVPLNAGFVLLINGSDFLPIPRQSHDVQILQVSCCGWT